MNAMRYASIGVCPRRLVHHDSKLSMNSLALKCGAERCRRQALDALHSARSGRATAHARSRIAQDKRIRHAHGRSGSATSLTGALSGAFRALGKRPVKFPGREFLGANHVRRLGQRSGKHVGRPFPVLQQSK
jgi:hypothetical protein